MARRTKQQRALIARTYRIPFEVDEQIAALAEAKGKAINSIVIDLLEKALTLSPVALATQAHSTPAMASTEPKPPW